MSELPSSQNSHMGSTQLSQETKNIKQEDQAGSLTSEGTSTTAGNGIATPSIATPGELFSKDTTPNIDLSNFPTPSMGTSNVGTPNIESLDPDFIKNMNLDSLTATEGLDLEAALGILPNNESNSNIATPFASSTNLARQGSSQKLSEVGTKKPTNMGQKSSLSTKPPTNGGNQAPPQQQPPQKAATAHTNQNPEELSDAVAAAGVNIRAEEEAMVSGLTVSKRQMEPNNFLKPGQLMWFMNKTMEDQGLKHMDFDNDLINLMSSACETYITGMVSDSIVVSRHRRRNVRTKQKQNVSNSKSDISRALKDIATKQKEREEKRVKRRIALGLEEEKKEEDMVAEHKQTNLTASMMMSGSKKKKYSWMQASTKNNSISNRGDNGIRYREAREESGVVLRDLMLAIENRRIGVNNTLVKGYAKMRD